MPIFIKRGKKTDYRKALLAIACGMLSYFISRLPIHIQLTTNYEITILAGLVLPVVISVIWGWRYGLLSALFGGIQAVWFSGLSQGYGLLYTVLMYAAWVVWHGIFSDLRKKQTETPKWYNNLFTVELTFRLVFESAYLVVFPYLVAFNPAVWQTSASVVSFPIERLFFIVSFRVVIGYVLMFMLKMLFWLTRLKTQKPDVPKVHGKNIIHVSLLFALVVIFIESIGATYFSAVQHGTVMENFLNFSSHQIFIRSLIFVSFLSFGFVLQYYFIKSKNAVKSLEETSTALKRHEEDINHVLQLASDIGKAEKIDPANFLSNLLAAAINIIPEANHGFTFRYQHGNKIILSQKGHDDALVGTRINIEAGVHAKDEVVLAHNLKSRLLSQISGSDYFKFRENMKNAAESMMILCEYEDEVIAGMVLGISLDAKTTRFSTQSLKIAGFLKDISVAFYNYLHLAEEREDTYKDIILSSLKILSLHNAYTKDHSTGVANLSREIALCMDFNYQEAETIYWAGLVHDIGKILISDDILDKGGKLTNEEFEIIKRHTVLGYETFRESPNLTDISKYIFHHHEKWDGSGYPYGLSRQNIPLHSRILSVADVFDALTHDRPYRKAISAEEALAYIRDNAGIQFDPDICDIFLKNFDSIYQKYNAS